MGTYEKFVETCSLLELIRIPPQDILALTEVLAGVVHMGEVAFVDSGESSCDIDAVCAEHVDYAAQLLGISQSSLRANVLSRTLHTMNDTVVTALSVGQARDVRDSISKEIYSKVFMWLVYVINDFTKHKDHNGPSSAVTTIAILDIFGFENLEVNGFEQLCINFANEKLQKIFTDDLFKKTQEEYKADGIPWQAVEYSDNEDVLNLIEGNNGIIALLNAQCIIMNGSDKKFLSTISTLSDSRLAFNSRILNSFTVHHYAGDISYDVSGFVERNKDVFMPECREMLAESEKPFVRFLFSFKLEDMGDSSIHANSQEKGGVGGRGKLTRPKSFINATTLSTQFRQQLTTLMEIIQAMKVHYVRCVKPNDFKSAVKFDSVRVIEQLRAAGVLEAIRISRQSYPFRLLTGEFYRRYKAILSSKRFTDKRKKSMVKHKSVIGQSNAHEARSHCMDIFRLVCSDDSPQHSHETVVRTTAGIDVVLSKLGYAVGISRTYFTSVLFTSLQQCHIRAKVLCSTCIQRCYRKVVCRRRLRKRIIGRIFIQRHIRGFLSRTNYRRFKSRLRAAQCLVRRFLRKCRIYAASIIRVQSFTRRTMATVKYKRTIALVIRLQSWSRCVVQKKKMKIRLEKYRHDLLLQNQLVNLKCELEREVSRRTALEEIVIQLSQQLQSSSSSNAPESGIDLQLRVDDSCERCRGLQENLDDVQGKLIVALDRIQELQTPPSQAPSSLEEPVESYSPLQEKFDTLQRKCTLLEMALQEAKKQIESHEIGLTAATDVIFQCEKDGPLERTPNACSAVCESLSCTTPDASLRCSFADNFTQTLENQEDRTKYDVGVQCSEVIMEGMLKDIHEVNSDSQSSTFNAKHQDPDDANHVVAASKPEVSPPRAISPITYHGVNHSDEANRSALYNVTNESLAFIHTPSTPPMLSIGSKDRDNSSVTGNIFIPISYNTNVHEEFQRHQHLLPQTKLDSNTFESIRAANEVLRNQILLAMVSRCFFSVCLHIT